MTRSMLLLLMSFILGTLGWSQCDNSLLVAAITQSGKDAVFIRDFKVKLKAGTKKKPSPVGHYSLFLKEGLTYRFNVVSAPEYEGKAVLQLYSNSQLLASTYNDSLQTDVGMCEYYCPYSTNYKVMISFREAKEGCAVAIASMVLDSASRSAMPVDSSFFVLYRDIPNVMSFKVPMNSGDTYEIAIDSGKVERKGDDFSIWVYESKWANLSITVQDSLRNPRYSLNRKFKVEDLPLPTIVFARRVGGYISKDEIFLNPTVELRMPIELDSVPYKLLRFSMYSANNMFEAFPSIDGNLTPRQIKFIESLSPGTRIVIRDAIVLHPNGKKMVLPELYFYVD